MILIFGTAAVLLFGWVVMSLWNGILPLVVTGVKAISFLQALGILVLSKILFGGFGGGKGRWRGGSAWREKMKHRWDKMSPEEKEKFKAQCKHWGNRWEKFDETTKTEDITSE